MAESGTGSIIKQGIVASIVVFLIVLPLCMGFAIASGVPMANGLITGIVGGIVGRLLAGCPLHVSGPERLIGGVIVADMEFGTAKGDVWSFCAKH